MAGQDACFIGTFISTREKLLLKTCRISYL